MEPAQTVEAMCYLIQKVELLEREVAILKLRNDNLTGINDLTREPKKEEKKDE